MAAFEIPEPLGYAYKSPIRHQAMQLINTQLPKAPNFVDGGATYTPADPIVVGGAGFELDGPTVFTANAETTFESISETTIASGATFTNNGAFYVDGPGIIYVRTNGLIIVQSTGEISVQTGGRLDVETGGAMNWRDGSIITAADGSTFQLADGSVLNTAGIVNFGSTNSITGSPKLVSGTTLTANSGSTVNLGGTTTLTGGTNLMLSPARSWTRHSLRICNVSYTSGSTSEAPEDPDAWIVNMTTPTGTAVETAAPFIMSRELQNDVGTFHWIELCDLPDGSTIDQVVIKSRGASGAGIVTVPQYLVVRWQPGGTVETMSASTPDVHTSINWSNTTLDTAITITDHATIDRSFTYAVIVRHASATGTPGARTMILGASASGTATSIRL